MSYTDLIIKELNHNRIPCYWITESQDTKRKYNRSNDAIKLSTLDSSKGLDFRVVFIVNLENMPFPLEKNEEREAALLYIGLTRATELLFLSYSGDSKFTRYFDKVMKSQQNEAQSLQQKMS